MRSFYLFSELLLRAGVRGGFRRLDLVTRKTFSMYDELSSEGDKIQWQVLFCVLPHVGDTNNSQMSTMVLADSQLPQQLPHWLRPPSSHSQLLQLTSDDFPVQGKVILNYTQYYTIPQIKWSKILFSKKMRWCIT